MSVLLGREPELAAIDRFVEGVRTGKGQCLVLRGCAGIGKSALLDYAAECASADMHVLRVAGVDGEAEMPYSALHLLLYPVLDRIDALPPVQASALRGAFGMGSAVGANPFLVGLATLALLSELATERPLLCLVDDAHFVDEASAQATMLAARRMEHDPIGLLVAIRDGEPALSREMPVMAVDGLPPEASAALLTRESPDLPAHRRDRVLETADGNPLALLELPKSVNEDDAYNTDPVPLTDRLRFIYQERLDRLDDEVRTLLLVAAAEGKGDLATVMRAAATLSLGEATLADVERSDLVTVGAGSLSFRHPLVRTAVWDAAPLPERRVVHRALAGVLENSDRLRWAWHMAAAAYGPDEKVAAALEDAADHALQRSGQAAAMRAYVRAAQLSDIEQARADRYMSAAIAAVEAGYLDRVEDLCAEATRLTDRPATLARVAEARSRVAFERGGPRAAARINIDGASGIAADDPEEAARLLVLATYYAGHAVDSRLAGDAVALLDTLGLPPDHPFLPYIQQARGFHRIMLGQEGDDAMFTAPRPTSVLEQTWTARLLNVAGNAAAALEVATAMAAAARKSGMISHLTNALFHQACAQAHLGRHRLATETAEQALIVADETGQDSLAAYLRGLLARLAAMTGDRDRCHALAADAIRYADHHGTPPSAVDATWALGLLELGEGHYDQALNLLDNRWPGWPRTSTWTLSTADHLEAAARAGERSVVTRLMKELETRGDVLLDPCAPAIVARCRALAASPASPASPAGAEPHFAAALSLGAAEDQPFQQARTLLAYGEWLRREHRRTDARLRLRAALELFDRIGAAPWADRARAELRATGDRTVSAVPDPQATVGLLTPQQLQVVRLAATGATNRDIGAQLFLSPRTVAQHLYHAYRKLGISSRTELAGLVLKD